MEASINKSEVSKMDNIKPSIWSTNRICPIIKHLKYEYLVAGMVGGTVSTLVLHPLDLLKLRFAVDDGHTKSVPHYSGIKSAVTQIVKEEGIKGLYRGMVPNVIGSASSWGCYFLVYHCLKTWIQDDKTSEALGPLMHMAAAAYAGVFTLSVTNPIGVIKTRLCLQYAEDIHLSESKRYSGMIDAFKKISTHEGIRGLYKGYLPGLFGVSHGALQFMAYEEIKIRYNKHKDKPSNTKLNATEYIACAAVSKLFASVLTYPYQVCRARLQDQHHNYRGTLHITKRIWRLEGMKGFYKGFTPYLLHVMPNVCLIYVVYEYVSNCFVK